MAEQTIESEVAIIAQKEQSAEKALAELHSQYPQVFEQIKNIEDAYAEVQTLKDKVKERLIADQDFDLHQVDGLRFSVSAVAKVKVEDIDKVPDGFKSTEVVANEKKAKEYLKVMGELPAGFTDASFYRLNWKMEK